jgi:putative ABC transport system permease protein
MQTLLQDLRYSVRMLLKNPGFASAAVITLALGIGINSAIFSVVNALLVRPLPFDDLDRIVALWERVPSQGVERNETAAANYFDWSAQQTSFERTGAYRGWSANLTGVDNPENMQGYLVTASLFDVLGVRPLHGRAFTAEEDQPGKENVVILNYGLWQRRFGGDPGIVGKTISINGVTRTVVGVMPPEFNYPPGAQLLAPLALTPSEAQNRGTHYMLVVARLKPGVSPAQAQAELDAIMARLERQYPDTNTGRGIGVFPLLEDTVRFYSQALLTLMCAVGFVLLIACANVANLMLARAAGRDKEMAIRTALGASRWRIVRGLFTESLLLAVLGGALGVLLAFWASDLFKSAIPAEFFDFVPGWKHIGVDLRVLAFAFSLSVFTALLFGLAPALQSSKPDLNAALKERGKSSYGGFGGGFGKRRLRSSLVIAEVALSFVLLILAGLMMKSFVRLVGADPGFNAESVLTMELSLPYAKYREAGQREAFYRQLLERVEALPGVETAGAVNHLPLGGSNTSTSFLVAGVPEPPPGQDFDGRWRICSPHYFRALGMTLLEGRAFVDQDMAGAQPVVIVNETLARKYWPNESAIGKRIRFTGDPARNPWMHVIGVVRDVKHKLDLEVTPEYYLPHAQDAWGEMLLVARTHGEPTALASAIRGEVWKLDKDQPVSRIRTMEQVSAESVMVQRHSVVALGVFATLALLLAAVGLYGVMSYTVTQRTNEIGIRVALGANPRDVMKLVIIQGMVLVLIGVAVGSLASLGLARLIETLLFDVEPTDPLTFGASAALLAIVALLACWIPARRAAKVDPMVALRQE